MKHFFQTVGLFNVVYSAELVHITSTWSTFVLTHSALRVACSHSPANRNSALQSHRKLTTVAADDTQDVPLPESSPQEGAADIADGRKQFSVRITSAGRSVDLKKQPVMTNFDRLNILII